MTFVSANRTSGDGDDICVSIQADSDLYIFKRGQSACIAGCIDASFYGFRAAADGTVTALGRNIAEPWFTDASECRKWLQSG